MSKNNGTSGKLSSNWKKYKIHQILWTIHDANPSPRQRRRSPSQVSVPPLQNLDEFDDGYYQEAVGRRQSQLDASLPGDTSENENETVNEKKDHFEWTYRPLNAKSDKKVHLPSNYTHITKRSLGILRKKEVEVTELKSKVAPIFMKG